MALVTDSPWQTIVAAALIGTARQPFQAPIVPGNLGQMLAQLKEQPTEAALLLAAVTLTLHQRVGWQPATLPVGASDPCAAEEMPRCSPRAARCLKHILQGQYAQLLPEWLNLATIAKQRVPELYLPTLLDKGRQQRELRAAILPVLGQRGRWLAAQNPDWSYAVTLTTETDWETGTSAARLLALQDFRSQQPDRARELLQATWSQEPAGDRAKFLETLRTGLSLADEPFLAQALSDRSKEVRRVATDLLASLPNSHLCQQITEQSCRYLRLEHNPNLSLQVQLPDHFDETWIPWGIEQKTSSAVSSKLGEKAWWLLQLIGATPLDTWTNRWQLSPPDIMQLTQFHEWQSVLIDGFALAAKRQKDYQWLEAIFKFWFTGQASIKRDVALVSLNTEDLINLLPGDRRDNLIIYLFRVLHKNISDSLIIWLLRYSSDEWSLELAHLFLEQLERYLNENKTFSNNDWELRSALKEVARFIPVSLTSEIIDLQSRLSTDNFWIQSFNDFLDLLIFRQDMAQAFKE